jgi:quinol monooxygenase YgiN
MSYFQLIEVQTTDYDSLERVHEEWRAATEGQRTVVAEWILRDRDRPDTYLIMVEFPSAEAAAVNNELPATGRIAEAMSALASAPPTFRNLDLVRED